MKITYNLEIQPNGTSEKLTNFRIAEAIINLCDDEHNTWMELDAEIVAKMILLQKEKNDVKD